MMRGVHVDPADVGALLAIDSLFGAQAFEELVDVREMIARHVFDKHARDFVVADAPINPAQEQDELHNAAEKIR